MKQIERLLNMTELERIEEFKLKSCQIYKGFYTEEKCRATTCNTCAIRLEYLNSEVPKNPLEEIGAKRVQVKPLSKFEKWEIETENYGTVYIRVNPILKSFDLIGDGTVEIAKAIVEYLETL